MRRARSVIDEKPKIKVFDEGSTSSSDHAAVYAHQEHARPRPKVEHILSPSTSDTSTSVSKQSLNSSISRFRSDFDELKCKMKIFGESLNLCRCIAQDFKLKLYNMEKRLEMLEKRQVVWRNQSNYSAIIQKNKKLSHITLADAKKLQLCKTEEDKRDIAARICRNYLHGAWKTVKSKSLLFQRVSGGLSNFLYYVALPDTDKSANVVRNSSDSTESEVLPPAVDYAQQSFSFSGEEPKNVLLRIYGQVLGERAMDSIVTETVIFTLLSERRLGPQLFGVFSGGRIEEFIPARCLTTRELAEPAISLKIAEKMAAIHSMNVPLNKEPTWMWKNFNKYMKTIKEDRLSGSYQPKNDEQKSIIEQLKTVDFEKEVEWLKKYVEQYASLVVFCHNDLQAGNILSLKDTPVHIHMVPAGEDDLSLSVNQSSVHVQTFDKDDQELSGEECEICDSLQLNPIEPRLYLIDFEYCAYNYRGFEIANHFQEWMIDYTNPNFPFYYLLEDNTPTFEQRDEFITQYLRYYAGNISDDSNPPPPTQKAIDDLRDEVDAFALASHLFWSIWAIVNATKSQIPFGYWEYGFNRFQFYNKLKIDAIKKEYSDSRKNSEM